MDVSGYSLTDDPKTPSKFVFPPGTIIEAFSNLVVRCEAPNGSTTGLVASLKLNKDGGSVSLFKPTPSGYILVDSVKYGLQPANFSIGRVNGVTGVWNLCEPTPGSDNIRQTLGGSTSVRINEWMADPDSGEDWLELYNMVDRTFPTP